MKWRPCHPVGHSACHSARHSGRAFTLIEVIVVLVILGILTVGAFPALGALQGARANSGADRVQSELFHARSLAMATGDPVGAVINTGSSSVQLVTLSDDEPERVLGPLGEPREPLRLTQVLPGVTITGYTAPDGGSTNPLWFGFSGLPELRDETGAAVSGEVGDTLIEIAGGPTLRVVGATGAITR